MKTIREFVHSTLTISQQTEVCREYEFYKITGKLRPTSILLETLSFLIKQDEELARHFVNIAELMDQFALEIYRCLALRYIAEEERYKR